MSQVPGRPGAAAAQPTPPGVRAALDAFLTCEFATLARDGTPIAWPASALIRSDGSMMLTTALAFPQKAFNVRRDPRVALLFSNPAGSSLVDPPQTLVTGTATCRDEVHTEPTGDLADFWRMIFRRQPASRRYLDWPVTRFTDFYFMRLLIQVTVTAATSRPLPETRNTVTDLAKLGAEVLAAYPTVVLAARDASGAPVLVRTSASDGPDGYKIELPDDAAVVEGPASLLVHRHDDQLWNLHNASVRGVLRQDAAGGWTLLPVRLTEPAARHRGGITDPIRIVRSSRATTRAYLEKRNWNRPAIPWDSYRALRAEVSS